MNRAKRFGSLRSKYTMIAGTIGGVMRKFSWILLVLLAFSVYAEDEKLLVVGSAKELKSIKAKKIIWKKDEAEMVLIRICSRYLERKVILLDTKICSC